MVPRNVATGSYSVKERGRPSLVAFDGPFFYSRFPRVCRDEATVSRIEIPGGGLVTLRPDGLVWTLGERTPAE